MKFLRWLFPPCEHAFSRSLFLRGIGLIYLIAILSWWIQAEALVGKNGLIPMASYLERVAEYMHLNDRSSLWSLPTLFWISSSNAFLHFLCALGTLLAIGVIAGVAAGPCLLGLWMIYLSLVNTGGVFMSFQWDILLLEAGVIATLLAPWSKLQMRWRNPPPLGWGERIALWLCWFAIAKLMFQSGWVKLAWANPAQPEWWPDHTALTFHYFTQPLPTWTAWWMHQLPVWFHKLSIWPMYFVELVLPLLVFLGARLRLVAASGFIGLMVLILATGNYTYFNLLTIVLCFPLIADRYWTVLPKLWEKIRNRFKSSGSDRRANPVESEPAGNSGRPAPRFSETGEIVSLSVRALPLFLIAVLNGIVFLRDLDRTHPGPSRLPDFAHSFANHFGRLQLVSGYGLFRTMTIERPEIIIEGSPNGIEWREYDLKWKPDKLHHRPKFVAPHQPRVAWQFWFFALEDRFHPGSRNAGWFSRIIIGLLENDPDVLGFFNRNPFPVDPPRFVRASLYRYEFTTIEERRETGNWWKRQRVGIFLERQGTETVRSSQRP